MGDPDPSREATADQRRAERRTASGPLRLLLAEQVVPGTSRDVSEGGVMFTTAAPLEVEVELLQDGRPVRRRGRLARVQRLNAGEWAFAVELDRD